MISQSAAYARGWVPPNEQRQVSKSRPARIGIGEKKNKGISAELKTALKRPEKNSSQQLFQDFGLDDRGERGRVATTAGASPDPIQQQQQQQQDATRFAWEQEV